MRRADSLLALSQSLLRSAAFGGASPQKTLDAITDLDRAATHDLLTGLPTRGVLLTRLANALESPPDGTEVAVFFVDVDNFKRVNDSLGHEAGDALLRELSLRVSACIGSDDTVSRFGGDELVVLLPEADAAQVAALVTRMLTAMAAPMRLAGRERVSSVSIGVAR